jgi:hypothetical protein
MKHFIILFVVAILYRLEAATNIQHSANEANSISIASKQTESINLEELNAKRYEAYRKAKKKAKGKLIFATNPPECKEYSTEGVCSLLNIEVSPYPEIAHVNTVLNFKFPKKLANCEAQSINTFDEKALGYDIEYKAPNTKADIYIYDIPLLQKADEAFMTNLAIDIALGVRDINPNAIFDKEILKKHFDSDNELTYYAFFAEYFSTAFNDEKSLKKCHTFVIVFSKNKKIVELRVTQSDCERKAFSQFIDNFVTEFDKEVILESKLRQEKFECKIVHPIIINEQP